MPQAVVPLQIVAQTLVTTLPERLFCWVKGNCGKVNVKHSAGDKRHKEFVWLPGKLPVLVYDDRVVCIALFFWIIENVTIVSIENVRYAFYELWRDKIKVPSPLH